MFFRNPCFSLVATILSRLHTLGRFGHVLCRCFACIILFFCTEWHMAVHTGELRVQNKSKRPISSMNTTAYSICPLNSGNASSNTSWDCNVTPGLKMCGYTSYHLFVLPVFRHATNKYISASRQAKIFKLYHSAEYISFPLESLGTLWNIWRWSSAHVYARGRKQCCKFHYCLWRVSIKPRLPFSSVVCSLFPKAIFLTFTLQLVLVPCGGGRTSPRTLP